MNLKKLQKQSLLPKKSRPERNAANKEDLLLRRKNKKLLKKPRKKLSRLLNRLRKVNKDPHIVWNRPQRTSSQTSLPSKVNKSPQQTDVNDRNKIMIAALSPNQRNLLRRNRDATGAMLNTKKTSLRMMLMMAVSRRTSTAESRLKKQLGTTSVPRVSKRENKLTKTAAR